MKKPILLGTALVASLGLIGGTFAAFMVSDKADPFGVRITPKVLDIDTSKKVTLEWGQKGLADIQNLKGGETRGDFEIGLKASQTGLTDTEVSAGYTGKFVVSLTDLTVRENENDPKLSEYLTIKVYDQPSTVANRVAIQTGAGDVDVTVPYGEQEKTLYITVSMAYVESTIMDKISNDVLYMQVDWNKNDDDDDAAEATTIYAAFPSGATEQKFHVFNATKSTDWPGEAGTLYSGNIYSYTFDQPYNEMVLTWKVNNELQQTENISFEGMTEAKPYWNGSAWAELPDASLTADYYLVGVFGEHEEWYQELANCPAFEISDEQNVEYKLVESITFKEGDGVKAVNKTKTDYYPAGDGNELKFGTGEGKIAPGTYDIYFRPNHNGNVDWVWGEGYYYLSLVK